MRVLSALFVLAAPVAASAQTVTIGETELPLGELAFAYDVQCSSADGCGGEIAYLGPPPWFPFYSMLSGLTAEHILDVVVTDLADDDEMLLAFPVPIRNDAGPDVYLAQARYFGELAQFDPQGINDFDIRFGSDPTWNTIAATQFAADPVFPIQTVWYIDSEIKSDAYSLFSTTLDLDAFGVAAGAAIDTLRIRGPVLPDWPDTVGLDVVTVASLNAGGWAGLGNGLTGSNGIPQLAGEGLPDDGQPVTLLLTDGLAFAPTWLVLGLSEFAAPFKQGVMVPQVDILVPGLALDDQGGLTLPFTWPDDFPAGFRLWWQFWIADAGGPAGFAATNGLLVQGL